MGDIAFIAIANGVKEKISNTFPDIEVYIDGNPEGAERPFFIVKIIRGEQTHQLHRKYKRTCSLQIKYVAEDVLTAGYHHIAEQLYGLLELAVVDREVFRGSEMFHEVIEGVLQFYVKYSYQIIKETLPGTKMQNLEQGEYIK